MQKPGFLSFEAHGKYLHLLQLALDHPLIFQCALVFMSGQGGKHRKEKDPLVTLFTYKKPALHRSAGLVSSEEWLKKF